MQVYGDRAHTARMRAALEGGSAWNPYAGARCRFFRSTEYSRPEADIIAYGTN
jgi:hypothetical protein